MRRPTGGCSRCRTSDLFLEKICDLCYNVVLLHTPLPPLPRAYGSWAQVITDWGVIRAFQQAGIPSCFKERPELAAPFVAEIGTAIFDKQLRQPAAKVRFLQEQVTEPAYEHVGGSSYCETRQAMESAQTDYLKLYGSHRADKRPPDLDISRHEMERHQAAFQALRGANQPAIQQIQNEAAKAYWNEQTSEGISDTFFADAAPNTAAARLRRLHPPWWGKFHHGLQIRLNHGHPAEGYLLDVLPQLRADAIKKKYEAVIDEWCEANAIQWGWDGKCHYRMRVLRGSKKARQLEAWFKAVAPDYLADAAVRHSMHTDLNDVLRELDPWSVPFSSDSVEFYIGGQGHN